MSEDKDKPMPFLAHLEEFRGRLVKSVVAIVIVAIVLFVYTTPIINTVYMSMMYSDFPTYKFFCWMGNLFDMSETLCVGDIPFSTQSTTPSGQFNTNMYFAFVGGFVIAFPFIFYQFWSFVRPALKQREFTVAKGAIFSASLLFIIGIGFGYFVVSPLCVQFFGSYKMTDATANIFTISSYISLITTTTLYTGLFFELPIFILIFSKLGLVTPEFLRKYRKHAVVIILIVAAIITPPDVISQVLVAIPVLLLYEISILVSAKVVAKKKNG